MSFKISEDARLLTFFEPPPPALKKMDKGVSYKKGVTLVLSFDFGPPLELGK
jgi:hypothetical protein